MKKGVANRLCLLFVIVGIFAMLAGCDGQDDEVGVLQQTADVRCEIAKVWAGEADVSPLPELNDCGLANNWHNLLADGLVTTDDSGEAWIDIDGCLIIYLFQHNGELRKSACQEGAGGIVCAISGTSVYNNQCSSEIIIQTASAQLVLEGTWLSVTYLPEMRLTLIMVFEGAVDVQPVLNFEEYTLGDPIQVKEGNFLFTAPGDQPPVIAGLPGRQAIPFEELPPVIEELMIIEPNLERWLDRMRVRAEEDDVPFPDFSRVPPPPEVGGLILTGGGDVWDDELVQEAILHAVDWVSLTENVFDQDVPVTVKRLGPSGQVGGVQPDARELGYDPGLAQELLAKVGLPDGFALILLVPPEDESLAVVAEWMIKDFAAVGIDANVAPVPADDMYAAMVEMMQAGQRPVLSLSRR